MTAGRTVVGSQEALGARGFWQEPHGTPLDRQRTSHLARLELSLAARISHQDHPQAAS